MLSSEAIQELTDVATYPNGREVDEVNGSAVAELVAAGMVVTRVEYWAGLATDVTVFEATTAGRAEAALLAAIDRKAA